MFNLTMLYAVLPLIFMFFVIYVAGKAEAEYLIQAGVPQKKALKALSLYKSVLLFIVGIYAGLAFAYILLSYLQGGVSG